MLSSPKQADWNEIADEGALPHLELEFCSFLEQSLGALLELLRRLGIHFHSRKLCSDTQHNLVEPVFLVLQRLCTRRLLQHMQLLCPVLCSFVWHLCCAAKAALSMLGQSGPWNCIARHAPPTLLSQCPAARCITALRQVRSTEGVPPVPSQHPDVRS